MICWLYSWNHMIHMTFWQWIYEVSAPDDKLNLVLWKCICYWTLNCAVLFTVCTDRLYIDLTPVERRRGICFQLGHVQIRSGKGSSQIPVHVPCSYEGVKKLCRAMMASTWLHTVGQMSRMRLGVPSSSHMLHRVAQLCGPGQIDDLDVRRWQFHLQAIEISDLSRCVQNNLQTILHNPSQSWIITCIMIPPHAKHYISWPSDTGMI